MRLDSKGKIIVVLLPILLLSLSLFSGLAGIDKDSLNGALPIERLTMANHLVAQLRYQQAHYSKAEDHIVAAKANYEKLHDMLSRMRMEKSNHIKSERPMLGSALQQMKSMKSVQDERNGIDAGELTAEGNNRQIPTGGWTVGWCHTPGHTTGSVSYVINGIGKTTAGSKVEEIEKTKQEIKNIQRYPLTMRDSTRVFPGHGPGTTIGEGKKHNPFLVTANHSSQ